MLEVLSTEATNEVRLSAEASSAKVGYTAHFATKVRAATHPATVPALGQCAYCHRGRAKRDR
ncbi:MAG: hypothetical protein JO283_15000 [Bradyrhizobium sp.]|nr:hypothetical protein [Bradyrhizobium sp.]